MQRTTGLAFGVSLLMLMLILLVAGCTQPSTTPASTATPTATATPLVTAQATTTPAAVITTPAVNATLKTEMAALVGTLAKKINTGNISIIMKEGENSTAFMATLSQLREFKATDSRIAYIYALEQKNGTATFLVDTDHGTPNASKCAEVYTDAPTEMKNIITEPIVVGPYTDHWGTFVSAIAPLNMGSNSSVILVIDSRV
ncbi:hypothetical protein [Methanoregula sp.]|uniref:hypothetical protein n=1 Tax=Methanoregula sp. TaxID=2052170 RepID=UPI003561D499